MMPGGAFKAADAVRDEILKAKAEISDMQQKAVESVRKNLWAAENACSEASLKVGRLLNARKAKETELEELRKDLKEKKEALAAVQNQYREANAVTEFTDPGLLQFQDPQFIKKFTNHQNLLAEAQNREFSEDSLVCPTCHREFPADQATAIREEFEKRKDDDIKELTASFDKFFKNNLSAIKEAGSAALRSVKDVESKITAGSTELEKIRKDWNDATAESGRAYEYKNSLPTKADISGNQEYLALQDKLSSLELQLGNMSTGDSLKQQLSAKEKEIRAELDAVNRKFADVEFNNATQEKIDSLRQELRTVSQQVADQERKVSLLEEFSRTKMNMISEKLNGVFGKATVKLFRDQINGGKSDTCEIELEGVAYKGVNDAGKIQLGLDVIKALQELYGVSVPVWLDNRESVTEIPAVDTQIINLYVSAADQELRVEVA